MLGRGRKDEIEISHEKGAMRASHNADGKRHIEKVFHRHRDEEEKEKGGALEEADDAKEVQ